MRLLFTGDWQLTFMNLDKAKEMLKEILEIVEVRRVDAIVNLGDMKEVYNPIDVRVANFAVDACSTLKRKNIEHLVLLGNHDRIGMYSDSQNWLPILEEAGALTYDRPEVVSLDGTVNLHMLPFMTDKEKLRVAAKELSKEAHENSLLAFHEDLNGCRYNLMTKSTSKITPADLQPEKYMFCIGGHIHLQHRVVENVWFAGSPFAMDWGEANQRKGYLLIDTKQKKIFRIFSKIPRLYDPLWPGFDKAKPDSWYGAEVRIHVSYDKSVHDLSALLTKARLRAQRDYPGAKILPVAEYTSDDKVNTFLDENSTDEEHVTEYVRQTVWDFLFPDADRIITYLTSRLKSVGISARQNTKIEFIRARGINFGSFKDIELNFKRNGITLLLGKNEDWRNRSNGSGKTTALQIPAVALFGQTFKGQKHDRWARRGSLKTAKAIVELKTLDGKHYKVIRWRRPHRLMLKYWNGLKWRDISSGNKKEVTQELIEKKIGFTWQTLANAIYIDQDRINALLAGTDGERRKLLEQFQNLERFNDAQAKVKVDLNTLEAQIQDTEAEIEGTKKAIEYTTSSMQALNVDDSYLTKVKKEYLAARDLHEQTQQKFSSQIKKWNKLADALIEKQEKYDSFLAVASERRSYLEARIELLEKYVSKAKTLSGGKCPTCEQHVDEKHAAKHIAETQAQIKEESKQLHVTNQEGDEYQQKLREIDEERSQIETTRDAKADLIERLSKEVYRKKSTYDSAKKIDEVKQEMVNKIKELKKILVIFQEDALQKKADVPFYEYCIEAFSRKGLPAFLNALLCPKLNKAAEFYSQQFADKAVQVRFESNREGEFDVKVMNAFGGENIEDQSRGEIKIASLITSFALRAVAISSNLLNLDEPGEGLDAQNARRFAESIRKLSARFGSIWLTSHNSSIISELSGERQWVVVKRNGVSELTT